MKDELENLLVDGKELDRKLVAEILSPYLRIDRETLDIRPRDTWDSLKSHIKILLYLLARKAMIALDLNLPEESASATEIMYKTGLKKGTVNPALRELFEVGAVEQTEKRRYLIPNYAIEKVKTIILKGL